MRILTIAGIAGVLVGVLVGFLWWGQPLQRAQHDLATLQGRQVADEVAREELKAARARLKKTEDELAMERERRTRLELTVSEGRK